MTTNLPQISFIIPVRNNLKYLKLCYKSLKNFANNHFIFILDDNSSDGTKLWAENLNDENLSYSIYENTENNSLPLGHTGLYNIGFNLAKEKTEIGVILHADMIISQKFVENLIKHLSHKTIVSATRIEPPIHPVGKEKIIMNFGLYDNEFEEKEFNNFSTILQLENKDKTTHGIFAPWMIFIDDYNKLGGMDLLFRPYPHEDADFFNRAVLNGFDLIQSRDSLCWHFTCKGHKFIEKVGVVHNMFDFYQAKALRNFLRKWGHPPMMNEYSYPLMIRKYNIGMIIIHATSDILIKFEPLFDTIYSDLNLNNLELNNYIESEQKLTSFDLKSKFKSITETKSNEIVCFLDNNKIDINIFQIIMSFKAFIADTINSIELGKLYEYNGISFYKNVINEDHQKYIDQFKPKNNL